MRLITVDMEATIEIDLYAEHAKATVANQRGMLERIKDNDDSDEKKAEALTALTEAIDASVEVADAIEEGAGPVLVLGYIKASKITNISLGSDETLPKTIEAARKICADGVVGWRGVDGQDGKSIDFDTETMLDTIERSGMLPTVRNLVLEYNTPTEEEIKK